MYYPYYLLALFTYLNYLFIHIIYLSILFIYPYYIAGTVTFGSWIDRHGSFYATAITLFVTPLGWGLACLGSKLQLYYLVLFGFGIFHGFGTALGYISTCSSIQKWFPEFKGLGK